MRSRPYSTSAAIVVALVITSCASPEQEARDAKKAATSWAASIATAAEQWQAGAVPAHFVASTLHAAHQEVSSEADRIRGRAGIDAVRPLEQILEALPAMIAACDRRDVAAVNARARDLVSALPPDPTPPVARPQ